MSELLRPELRPAVFFDRDGVLNPYVHYPAWGFDSPARPDELHLYPDAASAVRSLRDHGFLAILVSNQPGVAKGKFSHETFLALHNRTKSLLLAEGTALDGCFYCLHHPDAVVAEYRRVCECRKPKPGLLLQSARELQLDLANSYLIGDSAVDIEAAMAAGCSPVLVKRNGAAPERGPRSVTEAVTVVADLHAAVEHIVALETARVA